MIHRHQIHDALLQRGRDAMRRGELKDAARLTKAERRKAMPRMSESVAMWMREFDCPECEVYENGYGLIWRRSK